MSSWTYTARVVATPAVDFRLQTYKGKQKPHTRLPGLTASVTEKITELNSVAFGNITLDTRLWQESWYDAHIWGYATPPSLPSNEYFNAAYAKAYGKFIDACNLGAERSQMATNLAERMSTMEMVNKRMMQLLRGARQLKRGNFRGFLDTFGIKPKDKHSRTRWTRPQEFSGLWLEYWFGWAPTVADINNGLKIVSSHFGGEETLRGPIIARGAGSCNIATGLKRTYSSGSSSCFQKKTGRMTVRIQSDVIVEDGFSVMWNQLGLINPLTTAWELIPFSWFVGWFGNIAQVLGQSTDLAGLQLKNLTVSCRTYVDAYTATYPSWNQWAVRNIRYDGYVRTLPTVLPRVRLVWKCPAKLSPTRGATLASLITVLFSPSGPAKTEQLKRLSRG